MPIRLRSGPLEREDSGVRASIARLFAFAAFTALTGATATAQDRPVQEQLDELRAENQELRGEVADLRRVVTSADFSGDDSDYSFGLAANYGDLRANFQIFGDVLFESTNRDIRSNESGFAVGTLDVVANVQLGENFRVLSETAFEVDRDDETEVGLERLWGMWIYSDAFYAKIGGEHSPISRWNQLYHHGRWLETSATKPLLVGFEGGNGILPLHRTGLEVGGSHYSDAGRLEYFATVSNGRGTEPSDKSRKGDDTNSKAVDVGAAFSPFAISGLRFGGSVTYDKIPADPTSSDPDRNVFMREMITMANVEYLGEGFVIRAEYGMIEHEARSTNQDFDSDSGYVQLELPRGEWTPYTRYGFRDMDQGDPFYMTSDRDLDRWRQVVGVRYEPTENTAIKLELGYGADDVRVTPGVVREDDVVTMGLQFSWWL